MEQIALIRENSRTICIFVAIKFGCVGNCLYLCGVNSKIENYGEQK